MPSSLPFNKKTDRVDNVDKIYVNLSDKTIATTGNTDFYFTVPAGADRWKLVSAAFSGSANLAANDTNYITFTIRNITVGVESLGTNTTQATGGSAITADTAKTLTLTSTPADLVFDAGDVVRVRAAATGTLANTVTNANYSLVFEDNLIK